MTTVGAVIITITVFAVVIIIELPEHTCGDSIV